jgi:RES domain-containing protein
VIDSGAIETVLARLVPAPWSGTVYRVMLSDFPPDRQNTRGARWNPRELAAIYTCFDSDTCIKEVEYGLASQPLRVKSTLQKTLYEIQLTLASVVDLASVKNELDAAGITEADLLADDMQVSQEVGRIVTWLGFDGLRAPSARSRGTNLVIYPSRTIPESFGFEVVGSKTL